MTKFYFGWQCSARLVNRLVDILINVEHSTDVENNSLYSIYVQISGRLNWMASAFVVKNKNGNVLPKGWYLLLLISLFHFLLCFFFADVVCM